jgi:hypothetical protein
MSFDWGRARVRLVVVANIYITRNGFQNDLIQGRLEKMLTSSSDFGGAISVAFLDMGLF